MKHTMPSIKRGASTCALLLTGIALAILSSGCVKLTQSIPYRANLRLDIPVAQKRTNELTIRLSEELRRKEVVVKPIKMPLTMSYRFQIGKSLEGNLRSALKGLFSTNRISSLPISELNSSPLVLETELVSYDLKIGATIWSTHTANLVIRYSFYEGGRPVFTLETKTDGASTMSSGEKWGHVLISMSVDGSEAINASRYRGSIGRAYDEGLAKSVNELVDKILEVVPK